jgi:hypothetical protein
MKKRGRKKEKRNEDSLTVGGAQSSELHYHRYGLWSIFPSLLGSGPLGGLRGSKELWDKGI